MFLPTLIFARVAETLSTDIPALIYTLHQGPRLTWFQDHYLYFSHQNCHPPTAADFILRLGELI